MINFICEVMMWFASYIGVYQIIYLLWTEAEKEELGEAIVTKADTAVCIILSVIITSLLVIGKEKNTI